MTDVRLLKAEGVVEKKTMPRLLTPTSEERWLIEVRHGGLARLDGGTVTAFEKCQLPRPQGGLSSFLESRIDQ